MKPRQVLFLVIVASAACAGCAADPSGPAETSADAGATDSGLVASVAPLLRAGVDPAIFLPTVIQGYHPTAEELATSGKACSTEGDCATSGGQVIFHCSTPYYGQAQCQGAFPPGDQVQPGVVPSCVFYECPVDYECEAEAETHSVACIQSQHRGGRDGG